MRFYRHDCMLCYFSSGHKKTSYGFFCHRRSFAIFDYITILIMCSCSEAVAVDLADIVAEQDDLALQAVIVDRYGEELKNGVH